MNEIIKKLYHGNLYPLSDVKLESEGMELELRRSDLREAYRSLLNQDEAMKYDELIDLYESLEEEYYLLYYSGGMKHGIHLLLDVFNTKKNLGMIEKIFNGELCPAEQFELNQDNEKKIAYYDAFERYEKNIMKENIAVFNESMKLSDTISDIYYQKFYACGMICGMLLVIELYIN